LGLARAGDAGKYGLAENVGGLAVKPVGVGGGGNLAVRGDPIGASPPMADGASYDAPIYCCPRGGGGNLAVRGDSIGASPPITDGVSYDAPINCCPRGGECPIGLMGDRGRLPAVTMDLMGEGAEDRSAALSPPTRSAQDLPDRED
jgi:hypothetical protein